MSVMGDSSNKKWFSPYLKTHNNQCTIEESSIDDEETIVDCELGKPKLNIDYMKELCFQSTKTNPVNKIEFHP